MKATTLRVKLLVGLAVLFGVGVALAVGSATAQVPPHYPGTLCFTPYFWCPAQPPGPPGTPCICPSPVGLIPGTRG
jgi:hypothetical protein